MWSEAASIFTVKDLIKLNRAAYFIKSYTDCYEKKESFFRIDVLISSDTS